MALAIRSRLRHIKPSRRLESDLDDGQLKPGQPQPFFDDFEDDDDDFEGCPHGVSWNEECEDCEDED